MMFRIETHDQKAERLSDWSPWFAWHPVGLGDGGFFWLETVERRAEWTSSWHEGWWTWHYRRIHRLNCGSRQ